MFSGPNAPVACALAWCGWEVIAYDKVFGEACDLASSDGQKSAGADVRRADVVMWAPACDTMTKAREIPIPNHPRPPPPLRDAGHVLGRPHLSEKDQRRVEEANNFVDYMWDSIDELLPIGVGTGIENPKLSWLWHFPRAKTIKSRPQWGHWEYDACTHVRARAKHQVIEGNIEEFRIVVGRCQHMHEDNEWTPFQKPDGTWSYPGHAEAEFTANLAFNIAIACSMYAVRVRGYRMPIPKPLGVSEVGSRIGWTQLPPEAYRRQMMAPVAQRLGFTPPVMSPGPWFDQDWLAGQKAHRVQVDQLPSFCTAVVQDAPYRAAKSNIDSLVAADTKVMYIGSNHAMQNRYPSGWVLPQKVAKVEGAEDRSQAYQQWLQDNPACKAKVTELAGTALVCDCSVKERCHAEDIIQLYIERYLEDRSQLPVKTVFVGQGSNSGRLTRTEWATPFRVGDHGDHDLCQVKFAQWILSDAAEATRLRGKLSELQGCALVTDTPAGKPCHSEVLAAFVGCPCRTVKARKGPRRGRRLPQLVTATLAAMANGCWECPPVPQQMPVRWPQHSVDRAIRKIFPAEWTAGFAMPNLEDLINGAPFDIYPKYLEALELDSEQAVVPTVVADFGKGQRAAAEQVQKGHFFSKSATPQLVSLNLSPDRQFAAAAESARQGRFPLDESHILDLEIECAAEFMMANKDRLWEAREECYKPLVALAARMQPLTEHLKQYQVGSVKLIAGRVHLGLLAIAAVIMHWADYRIPPRYITGFFSLGELEFTGVLREVEVQPFLSKVELLAGAEEAIRKLERQYVDPESHQFLFETCIKEQEKNFAGPLYTREEMDAKWGVGQWIPLPRFAHIQPNGKKRPIEDAARFGHNEAASYTETIDSIGPTQPAQHIQALGRADRKLHQGEDGKPVDLSKYILETGSEDIPDAYRWVPSAPEEGYCNIVGVYDCARGRFVYQEIYGQVFGKTSAVVAFHRIQKLLTSAVRRWLQMLWSMYFDDGSLQDLSSARGRGQRYLRGTFRMFGVPLAVAKQVNLGSAADFLGLLHDVSATPTTGVVKFAPRDRMKEKVEQLIKERQQEGVTTPAQASKIRGVLGPCFAGYYGRIGRGGQHPLLQRQYWDAPPWNNSHSLERAYEYYLDLLQCDLRREVQVLKPPLVPLVIASDGRLDEADDGSVAMLVYDPVSGERQAVVGCIRAELRQAWDKQEGDKYIALVEQAAIILGISHFRAKLRNRDAVWYEDNAVVLAGLTKGASRDPYLDIGHSAIHLSLAHLRTRIWWEYVQSEANWADGPSRHLESDEWAKLHDFQICRAEIPTWPWSAPPRGPYEVHTPDDRVLILIDQRWEEEGPAMGVFYL